mgnify:CR=1 FL=1
MKSNVTEQVVSRHRRFCMSCGTKLAQSASKRVGLCQACRRHCVCCGQRAETYGHYDVCIQCGLLIGQKIERMKLGKGKFPKDRDADCCPARRAHCVACGDPAETVIAGRPHCAECRAEKEGAPPCMNCGDPTCDGNCERDESDQT